MILFEDTYVQITLRNITGDEIVANRTITRHGQHHPIFAERYPFNIQESFLSHITLVISVINKKSIDKHDRDFGSISFGMKISLMNLFVNFYFLGHNPTGHVQIAHWESMLNAQGETITRWHALLEQ
jgi:hypothetical protein